MRRDELEEAPVLSPIFYDMHTYTPGFYSCCRVPQPYPVSKSGPPVAALLLFDLKKLDSPRKYIYIYIYGIVCVAQCLLIEQKFWK